MICWTKTRYYSPRTGPARPANLPAADPPRPRLTRPPRAGGFRRASGRPRRRRRVHRSTRSGITEREVPMAGWRLLIVSVSLGTLAAAAPGEPPGSGGRQAPYRVGMTRALFPHLREDAFLRMATPFKKLMNDQAGLAGELALAADAETLAGQLKSGEAQ